MELLTVRIDKPEDANVILGQSHFIKTVEDLHEALVNSVPNLKFGLAFCEASGPCLVRASGNDESLVKLAQDNALARSPVTHSSSSSRKRILSTCSGRSRESPRCARSSAPRRTLWR
jgi:adenosine/AMP kinase